MKKFARYLVAMVVAGMTITPASARNSCDISIQTVGEARVDNYNALSREVKIEPIRLRLTNNGNRDCEGTIVFQRSDGDGRLVGPQNAALDYWIVDAGGFNNLLFDPGTSLQKSMPVQVKSGRTKEIRPRLFVHRGQEGISGIYRASIEAVFRPAGQPDDEERTTVRLSASVVPGVQANFVGVSRSNGRGGASLLDLGEIEPGMRRSVGLQVRANTEVDVEVSSENRGRLVQRRRGGGSIGYQMNVGGEAVNLGSQSDVVLPASVGRRGRTSRIVIQVENFDNAPAGQYGDTILFRISAR